LVWGWGLGLKYIELAASLTYYGTAASARTTRSRTTVGVAPTFSIEERLQKRKEVISELKK